MMPCVHMTRRFLVILCAMWLSACGQASEPLSDAERERILGPTETRYVEEKIDFTDVPYDFTGPTSIANLVGLIDERAFVFYGMAPGDIPPYREIRPGVYECGSRNEIVTLNALPATIEGIVTLTPRYFQKITYCDSDERFYGSYYLEDSTGGILILKESRVEDFDMGDRVRLRVRGLMKYFDTYAVLVSDEEEVVSKDHAIAYEEINRAFTVDDVRKVHRIERKVWGEATNQNFNEMCLVGVNDTLDEPCAKVCAFNTDCASNTCVFQTQNAVTGLCEREGGYWLASLDREIGQRQPRFLTKGTVLELTGPVVNSFGLKMLISKFGQITIKE